MLGAGDYWGTLKRILSKTPEELPCAYCGGERAWDELPDGRRLCAKCYDGGRYLEDANRRWADSWGRKQYRAHAEEETERW